MKSNTSDWFGGLSKNERKTLVCLLFDLRGTITGGHERKMLFVELMHRLDAEYHEAK